MVQLRTPQKQSNATYQKGSARDQAPNLDAPAGLNQPFSEKLRGYRDDAQPNRVQPNGRIHRPEFHEYELRFVMPLSVLEKSVDLEKLSGTLITQRYFHREHLPYIQYVLAELLELSSQTLEQMPLTSARVRKSEQLGKNRRKTECSYTLDMKGPKGLNADFPTERIELSAQLDQSRYNRFARLAERGMLSKERFTLPGEVHNSARGKAQSVAHPCRLEIDLLQCAGRPDNAEQGRNAQPLCEKFNFVTIDLEVSSRAALDAAMRGNHTFDFLKRHAVDLSTQSPKIQAALSARRIAKDGVDDAALKAIRKLRAQWGD